MTLLSDFHPKGEVSRLYGAYLEEWGTPNRSVVLIDEDGIVRWVHAEETPLTFPPRGADPRSVGAVLAQVRDLAQRCRSR